MCVCGRTFLFVVIELQRPLLPPTLPQWRPSRPTTSGTFPNGDDDDRTWSSSVSSTSDRLRGAHTEFGEGSSFPLPSINHESPTNAHTLTSNSRITPASPEPLRRFLALPTPAWRRRLSGNKYGTLSGVIAPTNSRTPEHTMFHKEGGARLARTWWHVLRAMIASCLSPDALTSRRTRYNMATD